VCRRSVLLYLSKRPSTQQTLVQTNLMLHSTTGFDWLDNHHQVVKLKHKIYNKIAKILFHCLHHKIRKSSSGFRVHCQLYTLRRSRAWLYEGTTRFSIISAITDSIYIYIYILWRLDGVSIVTWRLLLHNSESVAFP
jgi:hypothetical protein